MSGISSTIRINDAMSPALKSISNALTVVLTSFENLQRASNNPINVNGIRDAIVELETASQAVNDYVDNLQNASDSQNNLTDNVIATGNATDDLISKVSALVATYISLQSLMGTIRLSDELSQTESRLNLIVDDASIEALKEKIFESATRSRASYLETANAVASLAQRAGDAFSGNNEVIAFTEMLNKMYVIAGASAQEQASSLLQLTQAMGSGVLRGEEFNAVFEAAPNIIQSIADYMRVPIGALRDLASEGKITASIVKNALLNETNIKKVNEDFQSMSWTWTQVMNNFKNYSLRAFSPVLKKISELANNTEVLNFVVGLGIAMGAVSNGILNTFEAISSVGTFIYEQWSLLSPIIFGVASALTVYYGALLLSKAGAMALVMWNSILTFGKLMMASATFILTRATWSQATAQWGLNAAMYASPIVWILVFIISLISLLYLVVAGINKVTGTTYSTTGIIIGSLSVAGAFVWNLFLGILDLILGIVSLIKNVWVSFANFFANIFNDPIASIINLFADMAKQVFSLLEKIASGIDKVFGSNLSNSINGWKNGLDVFVSKAVSKYGNDSYEKITEEVNWSSETLGLKRLSYGNAWSSGYDFGASLKDKLPNFSFGENVDVSDDFEYSLDNLDALNNISNNTDDISKSLKITDEDLKYLRDIAEKEAINRFTTAEIKIDMGGVNNIVNERSDLDGIVDYLEDKLYESMLIASEGI